MLDLFKSMRIAKWSLMTIYLAYFRPQTDIFVKPTTTKKIIRHLELNSLTYSPVPSWEFYREWGFAYFEFTARTKPGWLIQHLYTRVKVGYLALAIVPDLYSR